MYAYIERKKGIKGMKFQKMLQYYMVVRLWPLWTWIGLVLIRRFKIRPYLWMCVLIGLYWHFLMRKTQKSRLRANALLGVLCFSFYIFFCLFAFSYFFHIIIIIIINVFIADNSLIICVMLQYEYRKRRKKHLNPLNYCFVFKRSNL